MEINRSEQELVRRGKLDSIKEYFDKFLFEYKGKYYSIDYNEALDVYNNCIEDIR